jgi:hypothetical protein
MLAEEENFAGLADGGSSCCPCQRDRPSADGADSSDERARDGKVLDTSVGASTNLKLLGLRERKNVWLRWSLGSPSVENPTGHCTQWQPGAYYH